MSSEATSFRRKRVSAVGAATLAAVLGLAACGGGNGDTTSDPGSGEGAEGAGAAAGGLQCSSESVADEQWSAAEPVTFSMLWTDWPENPITDDWILFDEIAERTNVTLELTNMSFSDAEERRSLLISAGDAPQIIPLIYTGDERQYAASGAVVPLSDYTDYMPNFNKYVQEWELEDMVENLRQADGRYYMTPGLQEVSVPVFTLIIRQDIFDEVGAPAPETWDDLREGLELIKEAYPDSQPLADGFEGHSMWNYASHAFGTVAGWGFGTGMWFDEDADEFVYAPTTDGYREMVTYFHGLADDGLLDTESLTDSNDGMGTVTEKFASEHVFAASGASGTVQEFAQALDAAGVTDYELTQIAPPGGSAGQVVEPRNFWNGFMLSSHAAEDENFCDLLHFVDWLYYNPEAREMLQWGIEDEHYSKDDDGTITLNPEYSLESFNINAGAETDIGDLGFSNDVLAGSTESRALKESYNAPEFVDYIDTVLSTRTPRDPFPNAPLTEAQLEQAALWGTPLKDTVDTATLAFIIGQRDLSEWDAFLGQLESQGLSSYEDLINEARENAENAG